MNSAITPFFFGSREVRGLLVEGEPWFVAKDVCDVLELSNITEALRGLDDDELTSELLKSGGQQREMKLVSESGLYALIFKSRKPEARAFRKWVTAEVLPALRKQGFYAAPAQGSRADIFHHRGPVSESGLDIRYTFDLTRVVLNPEPRILKLVQRLTGVNLDDLVEELEAARQTGPYAVFEDFVAERVRPCPGGEVGAAELYRAFRLWWVKRPGASAEPPSWHRFGRWFSYRAQRRRKPRGFIYVDIELAA